MSGAAQHQLEMDVLGALTAHSGAGLVSGEVRSPPLLSPLHGAAGELSEGWRGDALAGAAAGLAALEISALQARLAVLLQRLEKKRAGREKTSDTYGTPDDVYSAISDRYGPFDLDAAAAAWSAKCSVWFSREQNALVQSWGKARVFCNPPYSSPHLEAFVVQARLQVLLGTPLAALLIPATSDGTQWWRAYVRRRGVRISRQFDCLLAGLDVSGIVLRDGALQVEILTIYGRLRHITKRGRSAHTGRFASCVLVFRREEDAR